MSSLEEAIAIVTGRVNSFAAATQLAASSTRDATRAQEEYNAEAARGADTTSGMTGGTTSGGGIGATPGGSSSGDAGRTGGSAVATAIVTELQRRARR